MEVFGEDGSGGNGEHCVATELRYLNITLILRDFIKKNRHIDSLVSRNEHGKAVLRSSQVRLTKFTCFDPKGKLGEGELD